MSLLLFVAGVRSGEPGTSVYLGAGDAGGRCASVACPCACESYMIQPHKRDN